MPESRVQYKKSAMGASSVTLVPSTMNRDAMNAAEVTQLVLTTTGTPPVGFWGTTLTDGVEFEVLIRPKS
jgi:hypothetical protein